jgi:hypothetical protein
MRLLAVLACGLVTSAIALGLVQLVADHGTYLMGLHLAFVIPAGAMMIGLVASSGFMAGMWLSGRRADVASYVAVGLVLAAAYFGAHFVEYRRLNPDGEAGFWWFFDASTRAITMRGKELGAAGYLQRALELGGFVAGGLLGPLTMSNRPYCATCNRYRRGKLLAMVPYEHDVDGILQYATDAARLREQCEARGPASRHADFSRLGERFIVRLLFCPQCRAGAIVVEKLSGPPEQKSGLAIKSQPVDAELVAQLV